MPDISVSENTYVRLSEFKQVVEAVIEDELDFSTCSEIVLVQGLDAMLADLIGPLDKATILASFQQLASKTPADVYAYVADMIKQGAVAQQQEEMKGRIGFQTRSNQNMS